MSYLESSLAYALHRAQLSVMEGIVDALSDYQITTLGFLTLVVVAERPGISQAALVRALDVDRPRIAALLDELKARGLAKQTALVRDGLFKQVDLTKAGRQLVRVLRARAQEHQREMTARLSAPEAETVLSSLRKLAAKEPETKKKKTGGSARSRSPFHSSKNTGRANASAAKNAAGARSDDR